MTLPFIVYAIENDLDGTLYVGKGRDLESRWSRHVKIATSDFPSFKKMRGHLHRAIAKYGAESFSRTIIRECETEEEAFATEKKWILWLRSIGHRIYNITDGGQGASGRRPSELNISITRARSIGNKYAAGCRNNSKIGIDEVISIRNLLTTKNYSQQEIGKMFGVTASTVSLIKSGLRWAKVGV